MQAPKDFLGKKIWKRALSRSMTAEAKLLDNAAVSHRLKVLRHFVSGGNQSKFAADMGIEVRRWNNFERKFPLPRDVALLLCSKVPGLTLDWIYRGVEDGLPVGLQRELAATGSALTSAARRG
jgi:hypothetical protein